MVATCYCQYMSIGYALNSGDHGPSGDIAWTKYSPVTLHAFFAPECAYLGFSIGCEEAKVKGTCLSDSQFLPLDARRVFVLQYCHRFSQREHLHGAQTAYFWSRLA